MAPVPGQSSAEKEPVLLADIVDNEGRTEKSMKSMAIIKGFEKSKDDRLKLQHVSFKGSQVRKLTREDTLQGNLHRDHNSAWQKAQHRTFLKWVNFILRSNDPPREPIKDVQTGLKDGVVLGDILKNLSKGRFKYNIDRNPKNKLAAIANSNMVLSFLDEDNVPHVNIGSSDIYDENYTLDMGLLWELILHYQVSFNGLNKKKLLKWCQKRCALHNVEVTDFNKSWTDGRGFAAMVASFHPDYKFYKEDKKPTIPLMQGAFDFAEKNLKNVPAVLTPEDVLDYHDERSIITYLSLMYVQYHDMPLPTCNCFDDKKVFIVKEVSEPELKVVAVAVVKKEEPKPVPRVFHYAITGIYDGDNRAVADVTSHGTIHEAQKENQKDFDLRVKLFAPNGEEVPVDQHYNDDGTTSISFTPKQVGDHLLQIFHGDELMLSRMVPVYPPFILMEGPGINYGVAGLPTHFTAKVFTKEGGKQMDLKPNDPRLSFTFDRKVGGFLNDCNIANDVANVRYTPNREGMLEIYAHWREYPTTTSYVPVYDLELTHVIEDGEFVLGPNGCRAIVDIPKKFTIKLFHTHHVDIPESFLQDMTLSVACPHGSTVTLLENNYDPREASSTWTLLAAKSGFFDLDLSFHGMKIKSYPLRVVDLFVRVLGEGFYKTEVLKHSEFEVAFMDHPGGIIVPAGETFNCKITQPSGTPLKDVSLTHNENGTVTVKYVTTEEGPHHVDIIRRGDVQRTGTISSTDIHLKIVCRGSGIRAGIVGITSNFDMEIEAENGPLKDANTFKPRVEDPNGKEVPTIVDHINEKDMHVAYTPEVAGFHTIRFFYREKQVFSKSVPVYDVNFLNDRVGKDGQGMGTRFVKTFFHMKISIPGHAGKSLPSGLTLFAKSPSGEILPVKQEWTHMESHRKHKHHHHHHHGKHHHESEEEHSDSEDESEKEIAKIDSPRQKHAVHDMDPEYNYFFVPKEIGAHALLLAFAEEDLWSRAINVNELDVVFTRGHKHAAIADHTKRVHFKYQDNLTKETVYVENPDGNVQYHGAGEKVETNYHLTKPFRVVKHHGHVSFKPDQSGMYRVNALACGHKVGFLDIPCRQYFVETSNSHGMICFVPEWCAVRIVDEFGASKLHINDVKFELFYDAPGGLETVGFTTAENGDGLRFDWVPTRPGMYRIKVHHRSHRVHHDTLPCLLPWFQIEGPAADHAHLAEQNTIFCRQYNPYTKDFLATEYWAPATLEMLGPMSNNDDTTSYQPLELTTLGERPEERSYTFRPRARGRHLVSVLVGGIHVEQVNLPHVIPVNLIQYDSTVRVYFNDEDCYRKINMSKTYVTVGINKDHTAMDLIQNLHLKMRERLPHDKFEVFNEETRYFQIVEIPKPGGKDYVVGGLQAIISRDANTVHLEIPRINTNSPYVTEKKQKKIGDVILVATLGEQCHVSKHHFKYNHDLDCNTHFEFLLLDGHVPRTSKGRRERIYVSAWSKNKKVFIGGADFYIPEYDTQGEIEVLPLQHFSNEHFQEKFRIIHDDNAKKARKENKHDDVWEREKEEQEKEGRRLPFHENVWLFAHAEHPAKDFHGERKMSSDEKLARRISDEKLESRDHIAKGEHADANQGIVHHNSSSTLVNDRDGHGRHSHDHSPDRKEKKERKKEIAHDKKHKGGHDTEHGRPGDRHDEKHKTRPTVLAYKSFGASYLFDFKYPKKTKIDKECHIPVKVTDPRHDNDLVDDHHGVLQLRIITPSNKVVVVEAIRMKDDDHHEKKDKKGMYVFHFTPKELGLYRMNGVFNDSIIHANPAIVKVKKHRI